jgi:hypothetical protein
MGTRDSRKIEDVGTQDMGTRDSRREKGKS